MSDTSPILGIPWERVEADPVLPSDHNTVAHYLEHTIGNVLLGKLVEDGLINRDPDQCVIDTSTGRIARPDAGEPIVGVIRGRGFSMSSGLEVSGTANGGGTTYLTSSSLSEEDDFWVSAWVIITSGANNGAVREVTAYDQTQGRIEWSAPLGSAITSGDKFVVSFFYIQGLTNGTTNYVFGRTMGRTTRDGIIQWVASTSSSPAEGDILVASMVLDAAGNVTSANNAPYGHDRNLWTGAGAVHTVRFSGTISGLESGAFVDITIPHTKLILFGPISLTLDSELFSYSILETHDAESIKVRVTNDGNYAGTVSYSGYRMGRKWVYL